MDWERFKNIDPTVLGEVLRNPADHPISVAFLLAIVTLLLLIVLLVVLMVLVGRHDSGERQERSTRVPRPVADDRKKPPSGLMLTLIVLAFGFSVYVPASMSSTCSSCHTVAYECETWAKGAHAKVACVRCHEPRPVLLIAENLSDRLVNAGRWAASQPSSATVTTVDDIGCLGCHREDIEGVVKGPGDSDAIKMRHSDVQEAGYHCTDCHRDTGHSVVDQAPSGRDGMRRCLTCHDNRTASSECATCHTKDVMLASVAAGDPYPKVTLAPREDCEGCHSMRKCDGCHGLRLPHPRSFVDGGHAKLAAWEKKKWCWRCHTPQDCAACHTLYPEHFSAHALDWKRTHGGSTPLDDVDNCRVCHDIKPGKPFCRFCHPK